MTTITIDRAKCTDHELVVLREAELAVLHAVKRWDNDTRSASRTAALRQAVAMLREDEARIAKRIAQENRRIARRLRAAVPSPAAEDEADRRIVQIPEDCAEEGAAT